MMSLLFSSHNWVVLGCDVNCRDSIRCCFLLPSNNNEKLERWHSRNCFYFLPLPSPEMNGMQQVFSQGRGKLKGDEDRYR